MHGGAAAIAGILQQCGKPGQVKGCMVLGCNIGT